MTPDRPLPTPGTMLHRTADWIDEHEPQTYEDLCTGPLGDACSAQELRDLASQQAVDATTIPRLSAALRASADRADAGAKATR